MCRALQADHVLQLQDSMASSCHLGTLRLCGRRASDQATTAT